MTMMAPTPLRTSSLGMRSSTVNSTATNTSNFSDNALSTLESLVLECALEDARLKAEEGSTDNGNAVSTANPYEMKARDYAALQRLEGNDACADCGSSDTEWASVTFGILVCTSCSGHHRALGTHISRVRSVKMDQWSDQHLMRMKCGGNGAWQEHCSGEIDSMDSTTTTSYQEKYDSEAAREYLTLLKTRIAEKTLQQAEKEEENDNNDRTDDPLDDDRMSKSMSVVTGGTRSRLARSSASRTRSSGSGRSSARQSRSVSPMPGFGRSNSGPVAASSPTITYMGRSFPASSVPNQSSNLNNSLSNLAHNTPVLTPLLQALEQAKTKLTQDLLQNNSGHNHNSLDSSSAHRRQQYYQNNHPVASLFFSRQDILEITNDAQEFARLKRSLKHNGAVTNQVVTQRMFAFVANRRKRQEMMQQKQQQQRSSSSGKQPVA